MIRAIESLLALCVGDRRGRQRGSVLSGLLVIVAFVAILVGALMSELSSAFLVTRVHANRVATEATVNSAAEVGIYQLQNTQVPPRCAWDTSAISARGPWYMSLNGKAAKVTETCNAIVPDLAAPLAAGTFNVDGTHDTAGGRNSYVVGDTSGWLYSYSFGQTTQDWKIRLSSASTQPALATANSLLVPIGNRVALYDQSGGRTPTYVCDMRASATITQRPALEVTAGGAARFPSYAFSGDSLGNLYVYDASTGSGACNMKAQLDIGGSIVGDILVFPGAVTQSEKSDEVYVVVSTGQTTQLTHWTFSMDISGGGDGGGGSVTYSLEANADNVTLAVGTNMTGTAVSSRTPTARSTIRMVASTTSGRLAMANIAVGSGGTTYTLSAGPTKSLGGGTRSAPYWWHGPQYDLIGVANTNGTLYLLDTSLNTAWSYDGTADGKPALSTTPSVDVNGDWYVGADDGYVYDLEIPPGASQSLFKAARFGQGSPIMSSPIVGGTSDSCAAGPCLYFGSAGAGTYFVQLGQTRILDLDACVSTALGSTACITNPRLWARVQVAPANADRVSVIGWSYYTP